MAFDYAWAGFAIYGLIGFAVLWLLVVGSPFIIKLFNFGFTLVSLPFNILMGKKKGGAAALKKASRWTK